MGRDLGRDGNKQMKKEGKAWRGMGREGKKQVSRAEQKCSSKSDSSTYTQVREEKVRNQGNAKQHNQS